MIAVLLATLSGLSYGAGDFSGALATKRNNAALVTLIVQVISFAALGVLLLFTFDGAITTADLAWGALAGLGATVGLTTFYRALAEGPMSTAASVTALIGSLLPVSAGLLLGEVPNNPTLVGIALAIPSAIIVSIGGLEAHSLARTLNPRARAAARAQIAATRRLSIVAGLGFGVFFVALAQASPDAGLFPLVGARAASIVVLAAILTFQKTWNRVDRADYAPIGVAGLLDCAANSFYLLALAGGSVTWVAAVVSLYPAATVILARIFLKEHLSRVQIVGLVMASSSLVFVGLGAT
ncbi:MAG: putative membrane protein [Verrucomicrobiales bacterium]|jgi:uncharacterized membrane protein